MPEVTFEHSRYQPNLVGIGIVHIGLGGFHRAHQAAYLESWLNRRGGGEWGICAANIRSNKRLVDDLTAQNCRFHIAEFGDSERVAVREINSIRRALFAGPDKSPLLDQMTAPTTKIVSLTVTEKGYHLNPATGELLLEALDIAHDIDQPAAPNTAPGLLVAALKRRRALGMAPFTVLCCDNMPDNGRRAKQAVCTLARQNSAELADWIDDQVQFPATMVDRIVPAVSAAQARRLDALLGFSDPAAIACEKFSQWVIEDQFPLGRPDWETEGVEMVADVRPYETMKLRLLNGAHSLLAYVGLLRGKTTVAEAIADDALLSLVKRYFDEVSATLESQTQPTIEDYIAALLARFRNDAIEHQLSQIAMDGSQKIPQRWLEGALINLRQRRTIDATATGLAAWMAYVKGSDDRGNRWRVDDPMAARLADCHELATPDDIVGALLDIPEIFPEPLARSVDFRDAIQSAYPEALR